MLRLRFQGHLRALEFQRIPQLFNFPAVLLGGTACAAVPGYKEGFNGSAQFLKFFLWREILRVFRNHFGAHTFFQAVNYPEGVVYGTFPYVYYVSGAHVL